MVRALTAVRHVGRRAQARREGRPRPLQKWTGQGTTPRSLLTCFHLPILTSAQLWAQKLQALALKASREKLLERLRALAV